MTEFQWVAAAVICVVSAARLARLLIFDDFPPAAWLRNHAVAWMGESKWAKIAECPFCLAPHLVAGSMAWFHFTDGHWSWWVANGWWAASYLAAIVVAYDQPED